MSDIKTSTKIRKGIWLAVLLTIVGIAAVFFLSQETPQVSKAEPPKTFEKTFLPERVHPTEQFKILHIMSYHAPWKWTDDQFNGFKQALKGLDIEYKVFQMNTKNISTENWKQEAGRQARRLIDTWKPDLVYTNDDNAQTYVTKYYINKSTPFVFSGVNAYPKEYGFVGSTNIAGVLEQEHFLPSVRLLKEIKPDIRKIAVITDDGPTWPSVFKRMKEKKSRLPDIKFVGWDIVKTFEQYKQKIKYYENTADAVALLGIFSFKDNYGNNVPYKEVLKWNIKNSSLPDFSFWLDRVEHGTLCAVTVSGYEQGLAAGKIARGILVEGKKPSDYPFNPTVKGEPVINLARANKLGIKINAKTLLSSKVFKKIKSTDEP